MRAMLALTAHFDLELHRMDVNTAFLNGDLEEDIYIYIYIWLNFRDLFKGGRNHWFAN